MLSRPDVRLFLTSAAILFLELLLIRWISANVTYVSFFTNLLLMGSFLGIGLGILIGRGDFRAPVSPFGPLLLATVLLVHKAQLNIQVRSSDEVFFGLAESTAADANFLVLPLLVLLTALLLACLSAPLGPLLRSMPPLRAYAIDIAGALMGIASFSLLSLTWSPPIVWFSVLGVLVGLLALGTGVKRGSLLGAASFLAVLASIGTHPSAQRDLWSPYYRISMDTRLGTGFISVNGIGHQALWSRQHPLMDKMEPFRSQVYRWFPERTFDDVLVIGAGSGTDVSVALARGAKHVDAVEIDPRIARIGQDLHPDRPYDDPRVERHIDDGRRFLRKTDRKYDLIIFALPDSLTLVSAQANVRLETFLFTKECFASVREHLAKDGVFVLYNFYRQPWLIERLASMLEESMGTRPLVRTFAHMSASLACGPGVAALGSRSDLYQPPAGAAPLRPATDDWPFLYLREPGVPRHYLVALSLILASAVVLVVVACLATRTPVARTSPHFFVLGTAFLLLETRSLVTFSLLFGNTWLVNSLAFFGILTSVLAATLVNAKLAIAKPGLLYAGLLVAIGVAFVVPPESLFLDPPWLRYLAASALAFAPVFFANLVFTRSFKDTKSADMAFASNLVGAMVGGALEYLSLLTGFRALLLVAAGLYALALLLGSRWRTLGDRQLDGAPGP